MYENVDVNLENLVLAFKALKLVVLAKLSFLGHDKGNTVKSHFSGQV